MMFEDGFSWYQVLVLLLIPMKVISSQGLACYKCITQYQQDKFDACQDPFSSTLNPLHYNCQATSVGKNGTYAARFCVKITGRIVSVDDHANTSYLNSLFFYRTCVLDNIMDSTKLLETSGNFRLKGLPGIGGVVRLQGSMSLCTLDGCNDAKTSFQINLSLVIVVCMISQSIF